ncbi:MAG: D-alanine--D-alanine ligase [Bacillota bacterium]|uniref:D-alanine--D-alanine ligase n=1 Tax=Desulfurispora thermophila TaxID=265470 RepID=UPI000368D61F|nr:D-alanine--D-alanine ligase [Desulfurispora thermophila]
MLPRIGVLMGGKSAEREVSLRTGQAVYNALLQKGYDAVQIDVDDHIVDSLRKERVGLAFIALHGPGGEDGTIQGLLEILGIPYTGPGVLPSAICMDKITTKKILVYEGLPTPRFIIAKRREYQEKGLSNILLRMQGIVSLPVVVKAPRQGSTIGVTFVRQQAELPVALEEAFKYGAEALIEEMIDGIEVTAAVMGNGQPVALPLIEIVSKTGVYDYQAKYTVGMSEHIIPPRLPEDVQQRIKHLAESVYAALDCRGVVRVDFMVNKDNRPYILEVNTIPGMTETSLVPDAARAAGMEFADLVEKLAISAWENK